MGIVLDCYKRFENTAKTLPNFIVGGKEDVPYDITELADNYCKAFDEGDEIKKDQYMSALMVRYWYMIPLLYEQSRSTKLEMEDMISWLYEAFAKAFKYRSWQDPTKPISKDPKGAEKVINRCIYSVRNYWYQHFNMDKRKINYLISSSLDEPKNSGDYSGDDRVEAVIDGIAGDDDIKIDHCQAIIQNYIDKGNIIGAFILDGIVYQDSFNTTEYEVNTHELDEDGNEIVYERYDHTFSEKKLVKHLSHLSDSFRDYFLYRYDIDMETLTKAMLKLGKLKNSNIYKVVDKTLDDIRNDKELLASLC